MSMRLRFVLAFLVLSIAPLGALTWHAYASGARTLDEGTVRESDLLMRDIARRQRLALAAVEATFDVDHEGPADQPAAMDVDLSESVARAFVTVPARPGDIPFAIESTGEVHARTDEDRVRIEDMGVIGSLDLAPTVTPSADWIVATTAGPAGSGLQLGVARPLGQALADVRTDTVRGAAFGLLLLAAALVSVVPLSSRFIRHAPPLADGAGPLARIRHELDHGRRIQRDLLPSAPLALPSIHVAASTTPACEVGGDFFDYMSLPDGRVALVIGDVSGKGVGAALLMAHLQASLRTRLSLGQDLATLAADLDGGGAPESAYATLVVAIFDPKTRVLRYVNAGHPAPCIRRARGGVDHLAASGLPIGLLPGRTYETHEVALDPGDEVLFYTDGCTDPEKDDMTLMLARISR